MKSAEAYTLGTSDKVRIRVSEWQTVEGAFRDWTSVSGEYTVGQSGALSIPFVGEVAVDGQTTDYVGKLIGDRLQQRFGLSDRPDAAVEVAEYRPIYVLGDVTTPGAYPYAPNLSVIKAVSVAGGVRQSGLAGTRIERDVLNSAGASNVLEAERARLLARQARLEADISGRDAIEVPDGLRDVPDANKLIAVESGIMKAGRQRVALQLKALKDLQGLLEEEIRSLQQKRQTQARQLKLARDDLGSVGKLADRGLVVNSRISSLEQRIADLESRTLDIETAILRARQDFSKAEQDAIRLQNDRNQALAIERQEVDSKLEANALKLKTQKGLTREAVRLAPAVLAAAKADQYKFTVVRRVAGVVKELKVEENAELMPGDLVKVDLVLEDLGL